jgi:hypothetical protein
MNEGFLLPHSISHSSMKIYPLPSKSFTQEKLLPKKLQINGNRSFSRLSASKYYLTAKKRREILARLYRWRDLYDKILFCLLAFAQP